MAARFLKIYLVFLASALVINIPMEVFLASENLAMIGSITMFYILFSFPGALIFLKKSYKPRKMGMLSFILGFIFEFAFMKPDWVQNIYAFKIGGDVVATLIVSSIYWFVAWGVPSYAIRRYLSGSEEPFEKN